MPKLTEEQKTKMKEGRKKAVLAKRAQRDKADLTLDKKQVSALASVPDVQKNAYKQAMFGLAPIKQAVKIKCFECNNFEDYLKRTKDCNIKICPQ